MHASTPSQTIGPFFHVAIPHTGAVMVGPDGDLRLGGRVLDGTGAPVTDALVEMWDPVGGHVGRCPTDEEGEFAFVLTKPAPSAGAPHLDLWVFARGLLCGLGTRCYFPDEAAANATDPVLVAAGDRARTLIARAAGGGLRFDVRLQGDDETVFLAL